VICTASAVKGKVMKNEILRSVFLLTFTAALAVSPMMAQQSAEPAGFPARMVVTVEGRKGSTAAPVLNVQDVMVYEGHDRDKVADWLPLQGSHAGLELVILVDDAVNPAAGTRFDALRKFITDQPPSTAIGVAYLQDGTVFVAQNLTVDHAQAAKALRLPRGNRGTPGSPYIAIDELISGWPNQQVRREILLISDGADTLYGSGPSDPYVDHAIETAQKAGVIVFSIYAPGSNHFAHSTWRTNWGQNYESQLSDETGGEFYYLGTGEPVSFAPYLQDISQKLANQYLLTFVARSDDKPGARSVKLSTEVPNASLVAADRAYTVAGQ
jgi:hypothetical protein